MFLSLSSRVLPGAGGAHDKATNYTSRSIFGHQKRRRRQPRLTCVSQQRKDLNRRERHRMHALNDVFDTLRNLIPLDSCAKKPSKMETIMLAIDYIDFLTGLLISDSVHSNNKL